MFQKISILSLALLLFILITGALGPPIYLLDVNLGLLVVILEADAGDIIIIIVNGFSALLFERLLAIFLLLFLLIMFLLIFMPIFLIMIFVVLVFLSLDTFISLIWLLLLDV